MLSDVLRYQIDGSYLIARANRLLLPQGKNAEAGQLRERAQAVQAKVKKERFSKENWNARPRITRRCNRKSYFQRARRTILILGNAKSIVVISDQIATYFFFIRSAFSCLQPASCHLLRWSAALTAFPKKQVSQYFDSVAFLDIKLPRIVLSRGKVSRHPNHSYLNSYVRFNSAQSTIFKRNRQVVPKAGNIITISFLVDILSD